MKYCSVSTEQLNVSGVYAGCKCATLATFRFAFRIGNELMSKPDWAALAITSAMPLTAQGSGSPA
jgi:hypothetical protein